MPKTKTVQLELDEDTAQELSLLLRRAMRDSSREFAGELVDLLEDLKAKRVAAGWLSPDRSRS